MEQLSSYELVPMDVYIGQVVLSATVNTGQTNPNPKPNPVTGAGKPTGR